MEACQGPAASIIAITLHGEELGYDYHEASIRAKFTRRSCPEGSGDRELNLRGYKYNVTHVTERFRDVTFSSSSARHYCRYESTKFKYYDRSRSCQIAPSTDPLM